MQRPRFSAHGQNQIQKDIEFGAFFIHVFYAVVHRNNGKPNGTEDVKSVESHICVLEPNKITCSSFKIL